MNDESIIAVIQSHLGDKGVLTEDALKQKYTADASGELADSLPGAVFRPCSTEEVSFILEKCHQAGQSLSVQGGLTGLAGGAVPGSKELGLSLERMSGIEEIDSDSMTMTVLAGTPLQTIQEAAENAGFSFPLDLGSRGTCNIGGNVSTNAGGNQVIRFGMTRALILGLEAVLADGTVISSMNKMLKNNAGYDLKHLFIGTEGTLGIVTRIVLRLYPRLESRCTALCALSELDDVIQLLQLTNSSMAGLLSSYEVMWANYYDFILDNVKTLHSPFEEKHEFYVLMEIEGSNQEKDSLAFQAMLESALESELIKDAAIAQSEKEAGAFWGIRDGVADVLHILAQSANFDIGVPISQMGDFLEQAQTRLENAFPNIDIQIFGHLGDSNLHYLARTSDKKDKDRIYDIVYELIGEFDGSVTAEHGIGKLKRKYLNHSRSENEIQLMRQLKSSLDPKGILNPGRVV